MSGNELKSEILGFIETVHSIVGTYLDASTGFNLIYKQMMTLQQSTLRQLTGKLENPSVEYLDSLPFSYGKGDPNSPDAVVQHVTTQGTYKKRNAGNGENHRFIGNLCLISIFQFWEDYYRARIAKSLGLEKDEIKAPIMGDIRLIRRSIIHNQGIAIKEIGRCELLKWFTPGDVIFIDQAKLETIIAEIENFLQTLWEKGNE